MLSRLLIIILPVLASLPVDAATTLRGVILVNEVGGSPMPKVGVVAAGANPTTSEDFGRFTLEFPQKNPGDPVEVIVKKEGYVAVNDVQLQLILPAKADDKILTIILCKEGDREEMARRFYRLKSFEAIEATYQENLKAAENAHEADTEAFAAEKAKLQQERDQAKASAEKASEELAKNQTGELYLQARRLLLDGKIAEARAEADKAIDDTIQAWLLKAQLLTVQRRFDEAEKAYLQAIDVKPDSFDANFGFGRFNQELNRFENARIAYERCLEWARNNGKNAELATTLNNLGNLDHVQNRNEDARKEFEEALKTYRELAEKNPETYSPWVATVLNNLSILSRSQNRIEDAREEIVEALTIGRSLEDKNQETYLQNQETSLRIEAMALNNLASIDGDQNRNEDARKEFEEALKTYRELAQKNPKTYMPSVAKSLTKLGVLDRDQGRMEEARREYAEALQIYETAAKQEPGQFLPNVAQVKKLLEQLPK